MIGRGPGPRRRGRRPSRRQTPMGRTAAADSTAAGVTLEEGGPGTSAPPPVGRADGDGAAPAPLDEILAATARPRGPGASPGRLDRFLRETSPARALCLWLGLADPSAPRPDRAAIARRLSRDIARIDDLIGRQLDAILHHPSFQKLEASWRGLAYLVGKLPENASIKIRVLNLSWAELVQDQTRALEFDQS